jgi:AcrR family transcriptional regulator
MWSAHSNRWRVRRAARGKDELLAEAAEVIARRGIDHTRFADITEATGVAISTLQYSFGSREDLLLAVIEHAAKARLRRIGEVTASSLDPEGRLALLLQLALGESPSEPGGRLFWIEVWRAAVRDAEMRAVYTRMYDATLEALQQILHDGISQGLFPSTVNANDAAVQILALVDGLATPLLIEHPSLDSHKLRGLAADVCMTVLKIDHPISDIA